MNAGRVLALAASQIGVHEDPPNSNLQKYGEWAGKNGVAWCAIFQAWLFAHCGYDWRPIVGPGFAYTPTLESQLQKQLGFTKVIPRNARPGDIVFFDFPDSVYRIQHVGIIEKNDAIHCVLTTIEGNTSQSSNDNGGEVQRRYRTYDYAVSVLRPTYHVPERVVLKRTLKLTKPRTKGLDVIKIRQLVGCRNPLWPVYDNAAVAAVKKWQHVHGLTPDGEFGPKSAKTAGWVYSG